MSVRLRQTADIGKTKAMAKQAIDPVEPVADA
jgi:hypothetical protein